jgi:hypothetical protein
MTGFRSMSTCVAAHAVNGLGCDILIVLAYNDAFCGLCDLTKCSMQDKLCLYYEPPVKSSGNGEDA